MEASTPNMELVARVLDEIRSDLSRWDQDHWIDRNYYDSECGTTYCFGGFALLLSDRLRTEYDVNLGEGPYVYAVDAFGNPMGMPLAAKELLGFNQVVANQIFYTLGGLDFETFESRVYDIIEKHGKLTKEEVREKLEGRFRSS